MGGGLLALDTRLERTVAIKVLLSSISSSPEVRRRFEREAKAISQLWHLRACALYDVGREGERILPVMELLEARRRPIGSRRPLPPDQTLRFGVEIADALDKAHR